MKVTFLGSGCIIPQKERLPSSYLFEMNNMKILVDMGPGIFKRLSNTLSNPFCIDYLLLTHFHQDHIADLWPYIFARIYAQKYFNEIKPLSIIAHKNFVELFNNKKTVTDKWLENVTDLNIIPVEQNKFLQIENVKVECFKMNHKPESLGYRFAYNNVICSISGDTGLYDENGQKNELINLCQNSDLSILECSFADSNESNWHLSPHHIDKILELCSIKKIYLTHFYPFTKESNEMKNLIKKYPYIKLAKDGGIVNII